MPLELDLSKHTPLSVEGVLPPRPKDSNLPRLNNLEITLDGDPKAGVVHHIGNTHLSRHGNDLDGVIEGGQRKAAVIKTLISLGVKACFLESEGESTTTRK